MLKAIVIGLALISAPAMAQTKPITTGNDLIRYCGMIDQALTGQAPPTSLLNTVDEAYMQCVWLGTIAGIKFLANTATQNAEHPICVPNTASTGQLLSVVVRYLRNHPEQLNDSFPNLVMYAFLEAWPCKR